MPEERRREIYDGKGNLIAVETYWVSDDEIKREKAEDKIALMNATDPEKWSAKDQTDLLAAITLTLWGIPPKAVT